MKLVIFVLFTIIFISISQPTSSQHVSFITVEQLKHRLNQPGDTIYIVNFWATWCPPCVDELPIFDRSTIDFSVPPVKFLLVSLDFKNQIDSHLFPFLQKNHVREEVLVLNESNPNDWINSIDANWSGAIPATFICYRQMLNTQFHEGELTVLELYDLINHVKK